MTFLGRKATLATAMLLPLVAVGIVPLLTLMLGSYYNR